MFQAIDVLNGIAWDEENQRLFGGLFALAVHCFHRIQYSQPFLIRAMIDFFFLLVVTGKLWPKLYEIKLRPVDGPPDGSVEKLCPRASFY
jgi:hypothetical protein